MVLILLGLEIEPHPKSSNWVVEPRGMLRKTSVSIRKLINREEVGGLSLTEAFYSNQKLHLAGQGTASCDSQALPECFFLTSSFGTGAIC